MTTDETLRKAKRRPCLTETIRWRDAKRDKPNRTIAVLVKTDFIVHETYWDGKGFYGVSDALYWAPWPKGPAGGKA